MRSCGGSSSGGRGTRSCRSGSGRSCCHHGCTACPVMFRQHLSPQLPYYGPSARCRWCLVARPWNIDIWRVAVGDGKTHLSGVDLLTAEGVLVGTHVDGVEAVPVVLVVGLSSVAVVNQNGCVRKSRLTSLKVTLARHLGADEPQWLMQHHLPPHTSDHYFS
jgi:hypothetical protein